MNNVVRLYPESMLGRSWMLHELPDGHLQWIMTNDVGEVIAISDIMNSQEAHDFLAIQLNLDIKDLNEVKSRELDDTNPLYILEEE